MTPETTTAGMWVIGLAAVIAALLIIGRFARMAWRASRRLGHFLDDWFGEPERDGVPARPGIPARLSEVETHMGRMCERVSRVDERVQQIDHEMHPNSGASLRDAVDDIRAQTRHPSAPTVQQTFVTPSPEQGDE